jgi:hypothetical protein
LEMAMLSTQPSNDSDHQHEGQNRLWGAAKHEIERALARGELGIEEILEFRAALVEWQRQNT